MFRNLLIITLIFGVSLYADKNSDAIPTKKKSKTSSRITKDKPYNAKTATNRNENTKGKSKSSSYRPRPAAKPRSDIINAMINIGIGVGINHFYGSIGDDQMFFSSLELDMYGAISAEELKKHKHRVPDKYRKLVSGISGETKVSPGLIMLIPTSIILSPKTVKTNSEAYGATWTFWGYSFGMGLSESISLKVGASLPTITVLWINSEAMRYSETLWGLGASAKATLRFALSETFIVESFYRHNFYLPVLNEYRNLSNKEENLTHHGTIGLLLNFRIPYQTKL